MAKRRTRWVDDHVGATIANGGQLNTSLWGAVLQNDLWGGTITRVVGTLDLVSTTVAGVWGVQEAFIGMGVVSQEAFAAGSASLPSPSVDTEYPVGGWILRTNRLVMQNGEGGSFIVHVAFDLHAQRKIDTGEFVLSIQNLAKFGTNFPMAVHGSVRTLVLFP